MNEENALIRGQYKIVRVLRAETDFAAVVAVDIMDREQPFLLLNIYEGKAILRYAPAYDALAHCHEFKGVTMDGECFIAIFSWQEGRGIDQLFHRGADISWDIRLKYAHELLSLGLSVWAYPPEIGCSALLSTNLLVRPTEGKFAVNYVVAPMGELPKRELILLLTDQARKILIDRWDACDAERRFMKKLISEPWTSMVPLYSYWLEEKKNIEAEYEKQYKMGAIKRFFSLLLLNLRWRKKDKGKA